MLELEGIHTYYGLSHVLQGLNLRVAAGELVTLIGRNGAGKSNTLLHAARKLRRREFPDFRT